MRHESHIIVSQIRCWECNGNGIELPYPNKPWTLGVPCEACKGTGRKLGYRKFLFELKVIETPLQLWDKQFSQRQAIVA